MSLLLQESYHLPENLYAQDFILDKDPLASSSVKESNKLYLAVYIPPILTVAEVQPLHSNELRIVCIPDERKEISLILYDPVLGSLPLHVRSVLSRLLRVGISFGVPNCYHWNFVTEEIQDDLDNGEFGLPFYIPGVYIILNTITGQFYVGMSQHCLTRRLKNHLIDGEWTSPRLANALDFWGSENFVFACWIRPEDSPMGFGQYAVELEWQILSTHINKPNLMYNLVIPLRDGWNCHHYSIAKKGSSKWVVHNDDIRNFPAFHKTLQEKGFNSDLVWPCGHGIHTYYKIGGPTFTVYTY